MEPNKIAIIIPAFNEEYSIGNVVSELINFLGQEVTIIVVNDCSSDRTAVMAKNAGAVVVDLKVNHGYARAISRGFEYASVIPSVKYMLTMDGDGQHDPFSVKNFINYVLHNDADLVVGVRERFARFSEWLYGKYFYNKFHISDPLCGLKIYKKNLYVEYGHFETYDSIGTELLTWSLLNGLVVKQLPIKIRKRKDCSRFGSLWLANKRILFSLMKTISYVRRENSVNKYKTLSKL